MTDNVEYGPEIAVDGMPDWLGKDEKVIGRWGENTWYSGGPMWKKCYASPGAITAIRLPADHWAYKAIDAGFIPWGGGDRWAYKAIDAGFIPWGGGDAAPEGVTDVLFRGGISCATSGTSLRWTRTGWEGDIIGYKRGAGTDAAIDEIRTGDLPGFETVGELMDDLNDRVTIAKMTEAEAVALWNTYLDRDTTAREDIIDMLRSLGLIKSEPTLVEKFEDHYGSLDHNQRAILEIYQEWVAGQ